VPTAAVKFALMSPDVHRCHGGSPPRAASQQTLRNQAPHSAAIPLGHVAAQHVGGAAAEGRTRQPPHRPDGIGLDDRRQAVPAAIGPLQRTRDGCTRDVGCQPPSGARCAFVTSGFPIEQRDRLILRLFHGAARSSTGLRPRVAYCRSLPVCSEMPLSAPWAAMSSERPRSASATNPTSRLLWSMTGSRLT
jgi:hypothetical protein